MSTSSYHINKQRSDLQYPYSGGEKNVKEWAERTVEREKVEREIELRYLQDRVNVHPEVYRELTGQTNDLQYERPTGKERKKMHRNRHYLKQDLERLHQCKQCQNTFINEKGLCMAHEWAGKVPKPRHQWKLKRNRDE